MQFSFLKKRFFLVLRNRTQLLPDSNVNELYLPGYFLEIQIGGNHILCLHLVSLLILKEINMFMQSDLLINCQNEFDKIIKYMK